MAGCDRTAACARGNVCRNAITKGRTPKRPPNPHFVEQSYFEATAMTLTYTKAEPVILRGHADFNEAWLQKQIAEDPTILGLGDVELVGRERRQDKSGRLDLLLYDRRENTRYEVELMLGASDESHIIRCLEYWDIERRRYPAYDHCAAIVAENITGRFVNILSLFAGTVPLIAIQLSALKVGEQIVLNFVRVLDRVGLRHDDEVETPGGLADRDYWNTRSTPEVVSLADRLLQEINKKAKSPLQLNYVKHYIGLSDGNKSRNFVYFVPRKQYIIFYASVPDAPLLAKQLGDVGLETGVDKYTGAAWATVRPKEFNDAHTALSEAMATAVEKYEAD
jgi:hypothetical protein